jgi:beta-phosphoglucomutase-like phosphatase (HAD superfamily)
MERVKAVIFDWAGTIIDYGSLAPMGAFVETFGPSRRLPFCDAWREDAAAR